MARLSAVISAAVLTVLIVGVAGQGEWTIYGDGFQSVDLNSILQSICQSNISPAWTAFCSSIMTTTASTSISTTSSTTPTTAEQAQSSSTAASTTSASQTSASTANNNPSTQSASTLQRAHWCRLTNGSYLSLGQVFMHNGCTVCQCLQSRGVSCTTLQCMATYCIDGSTPTVRSGQCCSQCAYENTSTACVVNGVAFPHGTVLRQSGNTYQCWCQLGTVECRKGAISVFSSLDLWGEGTAVYVIVVIICVMLLCGTLLCCGCALLFYYYYQRSQQRAQQAYEEYYNNAGWQPMAEEGEEQAVDGSAEEKEAEAQQDPFEYEYPTGHSEEYIPPPYALYNGSFINEPTEKEQKLT